MAHEDDRLGERVERAITAADPRGVSLVLGRPIAEYEDYKPHTGKPRRRDRDTPGVYGARGNQTRTTPPVSYSRYELAFAAAQMDKLELAAVLWCAAGDGHARSTLKADLLLYALELKEHNGWPKKFERADCEYTGLVRCPYRWVTDLCTLALREGRNPEQYRTELARARWFGVSDRHWRRSILAGAYSSVHGRLVNLFNNGCADLSRRLTGRMRVRRAS